MSGAQGKGVFVGWVRRMSRPTLTGERVVLTPMSWDHLEDLCALDADPEVMRFLGRPRSRADVMALMPGACPQRRCPRPRLLGGA